MRGRTSLAWRVTQGNCAGGGQTLYHLAAELLRACLGIDAERAPTPESIEGMLAALDGGQAQALPALLTVLGLPPGDPAWERLDPAGRRRRTLDAIRDVLIA